MSTLDHLRPLLSSSAGQVYPTALVHAQIQSSAHERPDTSQGTASEQPLHTRFGHDLLGDLDAALVRDGLRHILDLLLQILLRSLYSLARGILQRTVRRLSRVLVCARTLSRGEHDARLDHIHRRRDDSRNRASTACADSCDPTALVYAPCPNTALVPVSLDRISYALEHGELNRCHGQVAAGQGSVASPQCQRIALEALHSLECGIDARAAFGVVHHLSILFDDLGWCQDGARDQFGGGRSGGVDERLR